MAIDKDNLLDAFGSAAIDDYPFVFVEVEAEGIREFIVIPEESFEAKQEFYTNAYNDDLVHVMNSKVKIVSVGFGTQNYFKEFVESAKKGR